MRLFPLLCALLLFLPVRAYAQEKRPTIVVATDLHFIAPELTDGGAYFTRIVENADGKVTFYVEPLADAFVEEIVRQKPDCLILSGDVTFNGARLSHVRLSKKLAAIRTAGIPVLVLPGNHDLSSGAAAKFMGDSYERVSGVTAEEFAAIYEDMGFKDAIARDEHSLSYIANPLPGVRVVMLDVNSPRARGTVSSDTLVWLRAQLEDAKAAGDKVIAVSHQNLFAHSDLLSAGFVIANSAELLSLYERYGVAVNLSGHMHIQHTKQSASGLLEIATSALSVSPCQYGVITLGNGEAEYRTQAVDVSAWARATGQTDENLLDFSAYAARFFARGKKESNAQKEAAQASLFARLNAAYFSGRMDTFTDDAEAETILATMPDSFSSQYIASMLREPRVDHTRVKFPF